MKSAVPVVISDEAFLRHIQQRVADLKERSRKLQAEADTIKEELVAYERVLTIEKQKTEGEEHGLNGNGNAERWRLFAEFCDMRVADGFTRPEVRDFFTERGINVGKNFPYFAVERWADRLDEKEGRYYPISKK